MLLVLLGSVLWTRYSTDPVTACSVSTRSIFRCFSGLKRKTNLITKNSSTRSRIHLLWLNCLLSLSALRCRRIILTWLSIKYWCRCLMRGRRRREWRGESQVMLLNTIDPLDSPGKRFLFCEHLNAWEEMQQLWTAGRVFVIKIKRRDVSGGRKKLQKQMKN